MPPFLSDYENESSSESDTHAISASKTKSQSYCPRVLREHAASSLSPEPERSPKGTPAVLSKKRKRGGLLSGLDMSNIIEIPSDEMAISTAEERVPASSVPPSSYRTRGSANGGRTLLYDQKYHPMDEYLRPSQAAKRRAEHGLDDDEDSDSVDFQDQGDDESENDVEDQPQTKKRKKFNKLAVRQGTRRSSRKVNRDVLYNANVHPQDSQLALMNIDSTVGAANDDGEMVSLAGSDAGDEVNEIVAITGSPVDEELDEEAARASSVAGRVVDVRAIRGSDDDVSDLTISSSPRSTPLSTISIDNSGHRVVISDNLHTVHYGDRSLPDLHMEQTPFEIYEEPPHVQLAKDTTATEPLDYEHDDKENTTEEPAISEEASNNTLVRPVTTARAAGEMNDTHDSYHADYLEPSSMFDDTNDRISIPSHLSRAAAPVNDINHDSILGNVIPSPGSEIDSVLGLPSHLHPLTRSS